MTEEDAMNGAKEILGRRGAEPNFLVLVDNPADCKTTINAFRKLGCKVKVEADGTRLIISRIA